MSILEYLFFVACLINWAIFALFALGSSDPRATDLRIAYTIASVLSLALALMGCIAHGVGWLI